MTSFVVATLLAQCFSRFDVATLLSFPSTAFWVTASVLCQDSSSLLCCTLRPHFCFYCLRSRLRLPFSGRDLVCGILLSQVLNLSCDLKLMSRPLLMFISLLLVATSILCCNQFLFSNLYARLRPQGDVATSR